MLFTILILLLIILTIQDISGRSIMAVVLYGALVVSFFYSSTLMPMRQIIISSLFNLVFTIIFLLGVTLYFSLKEKKAVNIFDKYFGLGDLLFLFILCISFSELYFLTYIICSSIAILIFSLLLDKIKVISRDNIPLAGFQSILLTIILTIEKITSLNLRF